MSDRRVLKITGGGRTEFHGQIASGHKKIGVKAPDTLNNDHTLTLPNTLVDNAFLKHGTGGALTWDGGSASSLQAAYNGGNTIVTVGGTPVDISGPAGLKTNLLQVTSTARFDSVVRIKGPEPWIDVSHPDYGAVGDGVANDTVAIQNALAAVPAGGATVFFPSGTYLVNRNALAVTISGTTLLGEAGSKLKSVNGSGNSHVLLDLGNFAGVTTDIRIINLEIDGSFGGWTLTGASQSHNINCKRLKRCWIQNCYIHDSAGDGVRFDISVAGQVCEQVYIENCIIDVCARSGITISDGNHLFITNNFVLNFNTAGIFSEPGVATIVTNTVTVTGNVFKPSAIQINAFNGNRVYGVGFKNQFGAGIEACGRVIIASNQFYGVDDAGTQYPASAIHIEVWRGVTIQGNFIYQTRGGISNLGVAADSFVEISNNHIRDCKTSAIQLAPKNVCVGNLCEDCDSNGIIAQGTDCTIVGNIVRNNGQNSGGAFSNVQRAGIRIMGNNCVVSGNRCFDDQAGKTQTYGIYVQDALTGVAINGNVVNTQLLEGIYIDQNCTGLIIEGNISTGNASYGILLTIGITGTIVSNNIVTGNNGAGTGIGLAESSLVNKVFRNIGYVTENSGTSTIPGGGALFLDINHGLGYGPANGRNIHVTLTNNTTNDIVKWYVSNITATQFRINVGADPGASGAIFDWYIHERS